MNVAATTPRAKSSAGHEDIARLMQRERVPIGRDGLPQALIPDSQRERIINAMAEVCAQKGYGSTTIADVVGAAGVSRATFYELFESKEECLLAAMEVALADGMGRIAEGYPADLPWAATVAHAAAALLSAGVDRPALTRMALIEAPVAGGRAFEMHAAGKRVLEALLDQGRSESAEAQRIPASAARGAMAAAESLVVGRILAGEVETLPQLLPDIVYIVTVPYLGQDEALRQSRQAERSLRSGNG